MLARVALLALLVAPLAAPLALAATPAPMTLEGAILVNGRGIEGARVEVLAGGVAIANATTVANGSYHVEVRGDDDATSAREGAREGEALRFRIRGAEAPGPAFRPGTTSSYDVRLSLPRLSVVAQGWTPSAPREGDAVRVQVVVANRGEAIAQTPIVRALLDGASVGSAPLSDLQPGESRGAEITLDLRGRAGDLALVLVAEARNGEADPEGSRAAVSLPVAADEPPRVGAVVATPSAPRAGENVTLSADVTDDEGVAYVRFSWEDAGETRTANLTAPPFQVDIGAFGDGARVVYWATAGDLGPRVKETTSARQVLAVGVERPTPTPASATSTQEDAGARTPGPGALLALGAGVAAAQLLRRRT